MRSFLIISAIGALLLPGATAYAQGNNAFGMNNAELDAPETGAAADPRQTKPATGKNIPKVESNAVGNFVGDRSTVDPDSLPVGGPKVSTPVATNVAPEIPETPATAAMPTNPAAGPTSAPSTLAPKNIAAPKPAPAATPAPVANSAPLPPPAMPIPPRKLDPANAVTNNAAPTPATAPVANAVANPAAEAVSEPVAEEVVDATPPPSPDKAPLAPDLPPPNEFGGAPYVPGSLKDLAFGEAPEEYVVEDGDTLYDICDQLIDEPDYWPKLWALNPEIRNPHFIFPRMRLKFFPGDATTPPFLNVVEEDDVVPVDKGGVLEAQMVPSKKDLSHLLLNSMKPVDVPLLSAEDVPVPEDIANGFEVWGETYKNTQISLVVPAFILAEEPEELGVVVAGIEGEFLTGYNTNIIVDGDGMAVGSTYTVLRASGQVRRPDNNGFVGYRYDFIGNVVAKAKIEDGYMEVSASFVRMGVKTGDILVPYKSTQRYTPSGDNVGSVTAPEGVILGFDQPLRSMGGQGDLVFLSAKASPGEYVKIYRDLRKNAAFAKKYMPETSRVAGYVRVIDTVGEASLGYIVRNEYDLRVGDTTSKTAM